MKADSISAPNGATTLSTNDDAAIIAAWERHKAAHAVYAALPFGDGLPLGSYTPEEQEQWDVIDAAEAVIKDNVATTPAGIEIQLWVSLAHNLSDQVDEQAAHDRDLDYFLADEGRFDWTDRLVIAAIRSLRAMQALTPDTAAWDAALAEYQPIQKRWAEDFDEGEALPTREERAAAYRAFQQRLPEYRAAREKFMAVPAPTMQALVTKMGMADPVDDYHFELCRRDAERLAGGAA